MTPEEIQDFIETHSLDELAETAWVLKQVAREKNKGTAASKLSRLNSCLSRLTKRQEKNIVLLVQPNRAQVCFSLDGQKIILSDQKVSDAFSWAKEVVSLLSAEGKCNGSADVRVIMLDTYMKEGITLPCLVEDKHGQMHPVYSWYNSAGIKLCAVKSTQEFLFWKNSATEKNPNDYKSIAALFSSLGISTKVEEKKILKSRKVVQASEPVELSLVGRKGEIATEEWWTEFVSLDSEHVVEKRTIPAEKNRKVWWHTFSTPSYTKMMKLVEKGTALGFKFDAADMRLRNKASVGSRHRVSWSEPRKG